MSTKSKNILFRADSSSSIGTGHIMRDLVLAQKYAKKGNKITFATQNIEGNINFKIKEAGYNLKILKSNDLEELDKLIKKLKIDMIVIDHYEIDKGQERKLKIKNKKLKIMVLDDTYEKHYCDILLNHNINADKKKYKEKVPKQCKLKCGSKYTLLRDEFIKEKKRLKKRFNTQDSTFNIFIAMGGADTANLNIPILKILSKYKNIKVTLVTTSSNQNLVTLQNYCKNKRWIDLQINSTKIAKLIRKSDFGIITPSVTANELYFMKTPFIAIKIADNQKEMYKFLKKKQYLTMDRFNKNKINQYIKKLLS